MAAREVRRALAEEVRIISWENPEYPRILQAFDSMPVVLYLRGILPPCVGGEEPPLGFSAGVVGSRRPSAYGVRQTRRFAEGLAKRGINVVSGLAVGIDGEAHSAALDAGGTTIAVLGSGLLRLYPREHRGLARRIWAEGRGALVTQFPLDAPPRDFHFPMRNQILSGLSHAVLVVEAGERSGSLITVRHALEQGRNVYVVPGRIGPESLGCLRLLVEGATPVLGPEDVLPGVGREIPASDTPTPLGGPFGSLLEALFEEEDAWHPDRVAERLQVSPSEILAELSRLELKGSLERRPGGAYVRRFTCR